MLELKDQWNYEYTNNNNYASHNTNSALNSHNNHSHNNHSHNTNGLYSKQISKKSNNNIVGSGLKSNSRQTKGFMKSKESSFGMVGFKSED